MLIYIYINVASDGWMWGRWTIDSIMLSCSVCLLLYQVCRGVNEPYVFIYVNGGGVRCVYGVFCTPSTMHSHSLSLSHPLTVSLSNPSSTCQPTSRTNLTINLHANCLTLALLLLNASTCLLFWWFGVLCVMLSVRVPARRCFAC